MVVGGGVKKSIINPHVKSSIAVIPCYSLQWVKYKKIGGGSTTNNCVNLFSDP